MSAAFVMIMFAVLLLLAVPISMALAAACIMPSVFDASFTASATYIVRAMFNALNSFPMLAVPMFILSGILMARGGISRRLFDLFSFLIGKRTAGLPCAVIVTCLFYGAISGSGVATVAAVGSMTLPILLRLGYEKKFCVAIIAVAGSLGVIIPPSIPFIMYGLASGESVSDLFTAGIVPGVLIALLLMTYAVYHCKKYGEDKEKIAAYIDELHGRGFVSVMKESFLAVLSPVIILGSIYSGIASPTEAAVISVFYALLIGLVVYKEIKPFMKDLKMVYQADTEELALEALDDLDEKWGKKYPSSIASWRNNWPQLSTYFKYPGEIRKLIYTTNSIENFNRQLRKVTKAKTIFPTDDALFKMLYLAMIDITKKWTGRGWNWGQTLDQLCIYFGDRIKPEDL